MIMRSGWGGVRLSGLFFLEGRRGRGLLHTTGREAPGGDLSWGGGSCKGHDTPAAPDMTTSSTALLPFEFHSYPHHNQAEDFHLRSQKEKKNVYT